MGPMRARTLLRPAAEAAAVFAVLTAVLAPVLGAGHITIASLVYLAATLAIAARSGYAIGLGAAVAANLLVNFFFVAPLHRFSVANRDNIAALVVFLGVAALGAYMLSKSRQEAARARLHESETQALLRITRAVADAPTPRMALDHLCQAAARALSARGGSLLAGEPLRVVAATIDDQSNLPLTRDELATAAEAWRRAEPVRLAHPNAGQDRTFVPLSGGETALLRLIGPIERAQLTNPFFIGLANEVRATLRRARLDEAASHARELERSSDFKSLLLSSAAHDLRTPLTAIKAAASSLRDTSVQWSEPDRAAFIETIDVQSDRLAKTVANLLEMSRLEGGARPKTELIEVGPMLAEAALSLASPGRAIRACAPDNVWIRGDYGLLMQALSNLVDNAVRHGQPGGPVRIAASRSPGRVLLAVSNDGPPIDPVDIPRLFDRFYRGKRAGNDPGSGLGLALVKAIVEGLGGTVSAASGPAETTFTMSLPAASPPP